MKKYQYIILFILFFILLNWVGGKILLLGVERFYGLKQHAAILLIGHSHLMLATDKDALQQGTGMKVSKYTIEGVSVYDRYFMIKQYLDSEYSDSLKVILYGVDPYSFVKGGLSENSYTLFYPYMDDPAINDYIKNAHSGKDYITHKLFPLTRYSDVSLNASLRGWRNDFSNYKTGSINIDAYKKGIDNNEKKYNRSIEIDPELLAIFEETMELATQRGIKVILVNTPIVDVLMQANNEDQDEVIRYYCKYAASHALVEYWDFNPEYSSNYKIFYDPIHLNPKGQELITLELVNRLKQTDI